MGERFKLSDQSYEEREGDIIMGYDYKSQVFVYFAAGYVFKQEIFKTNTSLSTIVSILDTVVIYVVSVLKLMQSDFHCNSQFIRMASFSANTARSSHMLHIFFSDFSS